MPKLRLDQYFSILLVSLACVASGIYVNRPMAGSAQPSLNDQLLWLQPAPVPVLKAAAIRDQLENTASGGGILNQLTAKAIYVMDVPSATQLLQKNSETTQYPASTTKLMTALVARDIYDLDQVLTVKQESFTAGTVVDLELGEQISVTNLLKGLLISSGNDAAFTLANNHPLGYQGFVSDMNTKAAALHLDQTSFTNPSGLDSDDHRSSARDLGLTAREVMHDQVLVNMVGTRSTTITDESGQIQHLLMTTNDLLGVEPGVVGVKTGTTPLAGEVLVTQVRRQGQEILIVVMGSQDRYADTKKIIEWVWQNYEWHQVPIDEVEITTE